MFTAALSVPLLGALLLAGASSTTSPAHKILLAYLALPLISITAAFLIVTLHIEGSSMTFALVKAFVLWALPPLIVFMVTRKSHDAAKGAAALFLASLIIPLAVSYSARGSRAEPDLVYGVFLVYLLIMSAAAGECSRRALTSASTVARAGIPWIVAGSVFMSVASYFFMSLLLSLRPGFP